MPLPILIAAILELAGWIFGEAAVDAAVAAAASYLGIEGGLAGLIAALEAMVIRWSPAAIEALEATLNPLPGTGGMIRSGQETFTRSAEFALREFSLKERAIMKAAIATARRRGITLKGAAFKEFLLNDLRMASTRLRAMLVKVTDVPQGLSGSWKFGEWMPSTHGFWTIYRQVDGTLAIQKIFARQLTEDVLKQAAKTAAESIHVIESMAPPRLHQIMHSPGVKRFLRLLANGEMQMVYAAPGCGDVVLTISKTIENPVIDRALVRASMWSTQSLWRL